MAADGERLGDVIVGIELRLILRLGALTIYFMPVSGGAADKFGNRYEVLWAIDQLLQIVDGTAVHLVFEPLDPDESRGVEFTVATTCGTTDYWSVKRQTTGASGWTLALLAVKDNRGRSILSDLLDHTESGPSHRGVFASSLGARDLEELQTHAATEALLDARLCRSRELKVQFLERVLTLCGGDRERARSFLLHTRQHAADERQLRGRVEFAIRKLFYAIDGTEIDAPAIRGYLSDLLLDNIHRPIPRQVILEQLSVHSIGLRDWAVDKSVRDRLESICDSYVLPLSSELINGNFLSIGGSEKLLNIGETHAAKKVLIVGGSGGGKSSSLADLVGRLRKSGTPVLFVRFDQLPEGILTTKELGHKLILPESPALVLAGVAAGNTSVLIVDQLDAISIASGRRTELWTLFDQLRREAEQFPNMSLVVGCREFDLEHDYRMRSMTVSGAGFAIARLQELSADQVENAFRSAGVEYASIQPELIPILRIPLHLSLFLKSAPEGRTGVRNRDELFGTFWIESERRVDQRLGRKAAWTQTIDKLASWLSENQELSAPEHVLDEFRADAGAMVSEHFIALADKRYRFFHESLFDYAFARRFSAKGGHLVDFLLAGEQHLFRRAQVRQVLSFLRVQEWPRYLQELEEVLSHARIRFHIKRLIFQWLSSLPDPRSQEWEVLQRLAASSTKIRRDVSGVTAGHPGWFDVLDKAGFFDAGLSSGEGKSEEEVILMLGLPSILQARSVRVSQLLSGYRKACEPWTQYLRHICRTGNVFHSREMFDLFLSLIDDGTLDGARPGFAVNDDWWSLLYSVAEKRPDLTCEVIAHWLDRRISRWRSFLATKTDREAQGEAWRRVRDECQQGMFHEPIISKAAEAPLNYVKEILPRVAQLVRETARDTPGHLNADPIWCMRSFGGDHFRVEDSIFSGLAHALETLAKNSPDELDQLLAPVQDLPCDAISFLVLRAWTAAASETYADHLAEYLSADPRRLKVGYQIGGTGSYGNHVSIQAVKSASTRCSLQRFQALEREILALRDEWEERQPRRRGWAQLALLCVMDSSRLSAAGAARLQELQRKFPQARHEEPQATRGGAVGSPISDDAQAKMSDEQWLKAMRKYSGVDQRFDRELSLSGGEHQLAIGLMSYAEKDPARFAALAAKMSDALPESYFEAIIRGIAGSLDRSKHQNSPQISADQAAALVRRVHALPGCPCGRAITWLFEKGYGISWPEDVIDVLAWHSVNDPSPKEDYWKKSEVDESQDGLGFGNPPRKPDPYSAGINSARGGAAEAVARILFDRPELFDRLQDSVYSLARDRSTSVRSCAILALLAVLNIDHHKAITWFNECVSSDSILLATPHTRTFVHYAAYRDLDSVWPVIESMLHSEDTSVVREAALEVCLLSLDLQVAEHLVRDVERGTNPMRESAARVYAMNVAHEVVGAVCCRKLKPFFSDPEVSVRTQAATAFEHISSLDTAAQSDLLAGFLASKPGSAALEVVIRALEKSQVQLPDLVCQVAELCVEAYGKDGGDISKPAGASAMGLSRIVVRLYAQTEDLAIQSRCLTIIDEMEYHQFLGLSDELRRMDR